MNFKRKRVDSVGRQYEITEQAFSETNSSPFIDQKTKFPASLKQAKNGKDE